MAKLKIEEAEEIHRLCALGLKHHQISKMFRVCRQTVTNISNGAWGFDPIPRKTTEERFWEKVDIPHGGFGCWEWQGAIGNHGYGSFFEWPVTHVSSRFAYTRYAGEIPEGMLVCHHCDNPKCVNPSHLFLGTHSDNSNDKIKKGREARKLSIPDKERAIDRVLAGEKVKDLALEYGVSGSLLYRYASERRGV